MFLFFSFDAERVSGRMWPLAWHSIVSCHVLVFRRLHFHFQVQHHLRRLHTLLRIIGAGM